MAAPVKVDVHLHLYPSVASGEWWKSGYEIFEYGPEPLDLEGVRFSDASGTVDEALAAMAAAGFSHGVVVNLLSVELFREEAMAMLPVDLTRAEQIEAVAAIDANMGDRFRAFNHWLVNTLAPLPQLTPFAGVDPWVLSPKQNVGHLRELAERGARGVKLHPVAQRAAPADPRLRPVWQACEELGLAVLAHSGTSKDGEGFAEPEVFVPLLRDFPELTVVLAHLGGGSWRQTAQLAAAFPSPRLAFDLCEIIEWSHGGAPKAPTPKELAALILDVGPERVLLGTDFPWYDLDRTAGLVMDLPLLATEQKEAILGANAVRVLGLPLTV